MKLLLIIPFALLILLLILIYNAVRSKKNGRKLGEKIIHLSEKEQLGYAQRLSEMIKCRTVSVKDSYDDTEFAKLRETVARLFPLLTEKAEKMTFGNDCWMYKIEGKNKNRNIMLMSHHDVVAENGEWEHPAFSGEIRDGVLWGRGTLDTKASLFAELSAVEELLSEGFEPECNVYIGSSHNEEIFGDGFALAREYFENQGIDFEIVIDEGGGIIDPPVSFVKCKCAMVATHEKGRCNLVASVKTKEGKAFVQANETAITIMSDFIAEISKKNIFIRRIHPVVKEMFEGLCPYMPFAARLVCANLRLFGGIIKTLAPKLVPMAGSMLGTTMAISKINGATAKNACIANLNLRFIDENDFEKDLAKLRKIAEKHGVELLDGDLNESYAPADTSCKEFEYVNRCIAEVFPHHASSVYLLTAGTDARHMTRLCPCTLRFAPIEMTAKQFDTIHKPNENINIDAIGNAVIFYKHFLKNYSEVDK